MDILVAATELAPIVKVGGLADVAAALPKALRLLGHRVTVAMPRFPELEAGGLLLARRLTPLALDLAGERTPVTVFDGRLSSGVDLVLFDAPGLFDRGYVYGVEGSVDEAKRFAVFCRAVAELARQRAAAGSPFDIVHAHDWPAAMVPYLLRHGPVELPTKTVLTIHNLAHQGLFPRSVLPLFGLDSAHFHPERLEFFGSISTLKGGLIAADALTTVSTTYAREIQTPEHGCRLDGVLRARAGSLTGIVNGIDYAVYNPTTDPALPARYDAEDVAQKGSCKAALLKEIGLPIDPDRPLVVSLGRVAHQKGSDLLAAALPAISRLDVAVAIAGSGETALEAQLTEACSRLHGAAAYLGHVSEPLSRRMLAAADIVVLPSRFEPCGLVQLYAQRYGALPVACRTGGLVDTVVDCDAALETGTGFLFDEPSASSLTAGVARAVAASRSPRWGALRRRVMRLDLGWDRPARRYALLYKTLLAGHDG